jgi:lipoprotein-anchoring transpeptidase ErfK/SrfK
MRGHGLLCAMAAALASLSAAPLLTHNQHRDRAAAQAGTAPIVPLTARAMQALRLQVGLDRAGFSPGEIDGAAGHNTSRALDAFRKSDGDPSRLPTDAVTSYRITEQDVAGPFTPDIPDDLMAQAQLSALNYRTILELLGEKFHSSPALLRLMNPRSGFAAGDEILVPNVLGAIQPVALRNRKHASSEDPAETTVTVSRGASSLTLTDGAGHLLFFATVTTGSEHDPLPIGDWKVTGVLRNPEFHYNPELFWDAEPAHSRATIAPGPNNPVGVVWINLDRPHYGLHGTPEPSLIGKTASHGCVRLTNWDASKLATLVHPGTPVVFVQ